MTAPATWTQPRVETLKQLWASGLSCSQIASRLGGCTRNAVIGKVHRLGLPGRVTTSRKKSVCRRPRAASSSPRKPNPRIPKKDRGFEFAPLPDAEVKAFVNGITPEDAGINRRPLAELNGHDCHWPIGDPRHDDFGFCGATALKGRPYCERHAARAYRAPEG